MTAFFIGSGPGQQKKNKTFDIGNNFDQVLSPFPEPFEENSVHLPQSLPPLLLGLGVDQVGQT